ncbi:MAG: YjbE family putative metal transport protein, partial [Vitreimonas sp.]
LIQVVLIDLALAADNAVAVGLAASALPAEQRRRAIFWGVLCALVLRIIFALVTVQLLQIRGILLFGGLLLFWVAWRMAKDLGKQDEAEKGEGAKKATTGFARAIFTIIIADVSMSLDNVLAVAGVSRHNPTIMTFGLVLSVILMGLAANMIAMIIQKHRWVAWVGVIVIILAGAQMIWEDLHRFFPQQIPALPHMMPTDPSPAH